MPVLRLLASFVGQIDRKLNNRINEHRNDINKKLKISHFEIQIQFHSLQFNHEFNFKNIR